MSRPRIVIEDKIPFIKGVFEPSCLVDYLPASQIAAEALAHAHAVITRTRPRFDGALLSGSPIRIIATATIGTDHIDLDYCRRHGLEVVNAPGCNAPAVAQWVLASILALTQGRKPSELTLGVVGVGHVGKIVERWGRHLGFRLLLNDPPRAEKEGSDSFVELERLARQADIVTFHTPLTSEGSHATFHLADRDFLELLKPGALLLNAARGGVVDEEALLERMARCPLTVAVDCWEGEPYISAALCAQAAIATPHIAGYSVEGKMRASATAAAAVAAKLNVEIKLPYGPPAVDLDHVDSETIATSYSPLADTARLKAAPDRFEHLRDHYTLRHEPSPAAG